MRKYKISTITNSLKNKRRKEIIINRKNIPRSTHILWSQKICEHLSKWVFEHDFKDILIYHAFKSEPCLSFFCRGLSPLYKTYLPKIICKDLHFYLWQKGDVLTRSLYGTYEPEIKKELKISDKTVLFVPCVSIDDFGNRLGYGGGFYDKFIENNPALPTVAILFNQDRIDNIPVDPWDQKVNFFCTETGITTIE